MIGIQIELSDNWKGSGEILWKTKDFAHHISEKVREIHRKKIEKFYGNFDRYNGKHTNTIRM